MLNKNQSKLFGISKKAIVFSILFVFGNAALAANYTVTNSNDSGSGSLRAAIVSANASSGVPDSIVFAIPTTDPNCAVPAGDVDRICTISPLTPLPTITDTISIDGSIPEQRPALLGERIPGSVKTPDVDATLRPGIEISGALSTAGNGITLANSNGHLIRGLVINRWRIGTIDTTRHGIYAENVSNSVFEGNYLGLDATGKLVSSPSVPTYGNASFGIVVNPFTQGTGIRIGGIGNNQRNIASNNASNGVALLNTSNSSILGNFAGTDVTGERAFGNVVEGIDLRTFTRNTGKVAANNRIEYNLALDSKSRTGFRLLGRSPSDPVRDTVVVNNIAGLSLLTHTPVPNFQGGLSISDRVIGSRVGFDLVNGAVVAMPNVFAGNRLYGIGVTSQPAGATFPRGVPVNNAFLFNKIYDNGTLPIDLTRDSAFAGDGVTPNDPPSAMDADGTSPEQSNHYQNFPVLDSERSLINPSLVKVDGALDSAPNTKYLIQIFSDNQSRCAPTNAAYPVNPACTAATPFLSAQAKVYLGGFTVTTNQYGHADFKEVVKEGITVGSFLSATATRVDASSGLPVETSEFSEAIDVDRRGVTTAYENAAGAAGGDQVDCEANPFSC